MIGFVSRRPEDSIAGIYGREKRRADGRALIGNRLRAPAPFASKTANPLREANWGSRVLGTKLNTVGVAAMCIAAAGCGGRGESPPSGQVSEQVLRQRENTPLAIRERERAERGTIWDLFRNQDDPNVTVAVNKYIWAAALDVLSFLPVESVDPFTGVIVTGYGTPPGGDLAYRATVHVQDPALDARSLSLALTTRSGPASRETVRAVEDAILSRARQLRVRDGGL